MHCRITRNLTRGLHLLPALMALFANIATPPARAEDPRAANMALIEEQLAEHIGTLAYVWGYPMVDMSTQMFNETHRVAPEQAVLAPVNSFHRREFLVTPSTAGALRGPNNDTLYLSGWFDLTREPVIVRVPDTHGRYYTLAITDFFNEVTHVGRRTTGTAEGYFALIGPGYEGKLPEGVKQIRLATNQVWVLGRILVNGEEDFPQALALMREFWSAPLSQWKRGTPPAVAAVAAATPMEPRESLEFFAVLNRWLRVNRAPATEEALLALFDQVGVGPNRDFDAATLGEPVRRGLEKAIANGRALLVATAQMPMPDVRNGWIFPLGLADYGHDYLKRANVVYSGYANRPEESTYAARTVDGAGELMSGAKRYRLHFTPAEIPPAGAFWSLVAYDLKTRNLIENGLRRYSIGDRTPGLEKNPDGSFDILIQSEQPAAGTGNWLPVSDAPFMLVVRIYEPGRGVFDGSYQLPALETLD
jgi:hypothetical protein